MSIAFNNIDYVAFALASIAVLVVISVWLRRTGPSHRSGLWSWMLLVTILLPGWFLAQAADPSERPWVIGLLAALVVSCLVSVVIIRLLVASRERFELVIQGANDGIWDWNVITDKVYFSPRWKSMLGWEDHEIANDFKEWETRLHPDDRERALETIKLYFEGQTFSYEMEHRLQHRDGSYRWILTRGLALRDATGRPYRMVGSHVDMTALKNAELALRDSEARLKTLVEHAPEAILLLDAAAGRFVEANPKAEELLGLTREQLLQVHPVDVSPPRQMDGRPSTEAARDHIQRALQGSTEIFDWTHCNAKTQQEIPCEVRLVRLPGRDGQVLRASITDISGRKETEQVLRQAKEEAEAANRAKSEFLANMSHEIRTPMNGIIGMTELLTHTSLDAQQLDHLRIVQQSADSLMRLLNDILDFSKIEAGKLELECGEFDLRDCIETTVRAMAASASDKGIELACRVAPDLPEVCVGDSGRLSQIVVNLVGNAIKFTQQGEVVLDVGRDEAAPPARLHFSVQDTGIGIPPRQQTRIFDAFSQADTSTTREFGGTGLGLAICAQLVGMMEGRIWVESEVGRGSTFHFTVSLDVPSATAARRAGQLENVEGLPVLVLDDSPVNRRVLVEILESWKLQPAVADSGVAALTMMAAARDRGQPFQLAIVDRKMPEMDGFEFAAKVIADSSLSDCKMIMVSSASQPGDGDRCRRTGIGRYLTRPVVQSELLRAILDLCDSVPSAERPPPVSEPSLAVPNRTFNVLLVEDSIVNQQVAIGFLHAVGHRVTVANNGKEALSLLEENSFDVILMDVQMPEMDGIAATRVIRQREEQSAGSHVPIVAMTAAAMKGDRERCLEAGMDAYVAKPIVSDQLYNAIDKVTSGSRPDEAATRTGDDRQPQPEAAVAHPDGLLRQIAADQGMSLEEGKELVEAFLEECSQMMTGIRQAMADQDAESLRQCAHTLKSSAKILGDGPLAEAALQVECKGRNGDLEEAQTPLSQLEQEVTRCRTALEAALSGTSVPPKAEVKTRE